jgi:hypothetical protein
MGGLASFFSFLGADSTTTELPEIYELGTDQGEFVKTDVITLYSKILTDVFERTQGLDKKQEPMLWDNCVQSESSDGLVSLIAKAMYEKKDLFIVYEPAIDVIRVATSSEQEQIKKGFKKELRANLGDGKIGAYISFKNFDRNDMIKLYSGLEYCTISSLYKNMNLSKAIQIKAHKLREGVGANDSSVAKAQAQAIAQNLKDGKDVLLDAEDTIETAKPDISATEKSETFINQKLSKYLGLPAAYITGVQTGGLGTTGENDTKATERGLKNYFHSIVQPVCKAIFEKDVTYKSQDIGQISQGLEALKTFELTSERFITAENKKVVVESLFDLDETDNKTNLEEGQANGQQQQPDGGQRVQPGKEKTVPAVQN